MKELIALTPEHIEYTIDQGDFPPEVLESKTRVAVVMTQDWCPQWGYMKDYLPGIEDADLDIYVTLYNTEAYGDAFMEFKEDVFENALIPYVRYYVNGQFKKASNFVSREHFIQLTGT